MLYRVLMLMWPTSDLLRYTKSAQPQSAQPAWCLGKKHDLM